MAAASLKQCSCLTSVVLQFSSAWHRTGKGAAGLIGMLSNAAALKRPLAAPTKYQVSETGDLNSSRQETADGHCESIGGKTFHVIELTSRFFIRPAAFPIARDPFSLATGADSSGSLRPRRRRCVLQLRHTSVSSFGFESNTRRFERSRFHLLYTCRINNVDGDTFSPAPVFTTTRVAFAFNFTASRLQILNVYITNGDDIASRS
ncbi:MAG TPA: hypothetical protein VGF73_03645 [Chthoniobacterales bacterium]|jgi:hypothetical protein